MAGELVENKTQAIMSTFLIGAEGYLRQSARAARVMARWHEIALECGAEWDGMDGYTFTPAQHDEYTRRCTEEGAL